MSTNTFNRQKQHYDFENGIMKKLFALAYAFVSYSIGAGALFWLFFAAAGLAPYALSEFKADNTAGAFLINLALVSLFALQHSLMARKTLKDKWIRIIPGHLERAAYVLASGIFMGLTLWFWQPLPGSVWSITDPVWKGTVQGISLLGAAYILVSSFITNHFELFGLRQAWLFANGKHHAPLEFKRKLMYRYSRHPMMAGMVVVLWAAPEMTVTRLTLGLLLTLYLFIGIQFEERGLIAEFGDKYRQYKNEIGLFFTIR
jgi:protein-S-isoprenylcysteine O-methyltransferase Ste14